LEQALKAEAGTRCCGSDCGSTIASSAGLPWVDMDDEDTYSYAFSDINAGAVDAHVADAWSDQEPAGTAATSLAANVAAQPEDENCCEISRDCPSSHFLEALRRVGSRERAAVATRSATSSVPVTAPTVPLATPRRPRPTSAKALLLDVTIAGALLGSKTGPPREQPAVGARAGTAESEATQRLAASPAVSADFLDPRIKRSHFLQAVAVLRERAARGDLPPRRSPSPSDDALRAVS